MDCINIFNKGWNFSQDGPGNRLLYHFQGCNLCCPWCSNPEGIAMQGSMLVYKDKLMDKVCPRGAIRNKTVDRAICNNCPEKECTRQNRNEGIRCSVQCYKTDDIIREIEQSKGLFHSGGGVTITGGEPTLQFNSLKWLLARIKNIQVNTAMETNGTSERLPELFEWIDTLIIDLKHPDTTIHKKWLGLGNEKIITNLKKSSESKKNVWVRIPLIPDFNDSAEDITKMIRILKPMQRENLSVELLNYHEYGKIKWEQIGLNYSMPGKKIAPEKWNLYKEMFKANQVKIINT